MARWKTHPVKEFASYLAICQEHTDDYTRHCEMECQIELVLSTQDIQGWVSSRETSHHRFLSGMMSTQTHRQTQTQTDRQTHTHTHAHTHTHTHAHTCTASTQSSHSSWTYPRMSHARRRWMKMRYSKRAIRTLGCARTSRRVKPRLHVNTQSQQSTYLIWRLSSLLGGWGQVLAAR